MYVFLIKTYSHLDIEVVFAMPLTLQLESHAYQCSGYAVDCIENLANQK
jgi:hypothetical protein